MIHPASHLLRETLYVLSFFILNFSLINFVKYSLTIRNENFPFSQYQQRKKFSQNSISIENRLWIRYIWLKY